MSPSIRWRVHLRSAPGEVHRMLATPGGRARFWAESAEEMVEAGGDRVVRFRFSGGVELESRVLESSPSSRFRLSYFGGSVVTFDLEPDGAGGTDLTLTEVGAPPAEHAQNRAGWVSVLLALKAAVDFGIDLRSHDPGRTWDDGFVDA